MQFSILTLSGRAQYIEKENIHYTTLLHSRLDVYRGSASPETLCILDPREPHWPLQRVEAASSLHPC